MQDAIKALEEQIIERNRRIGELEKKLKDCNKLKQGYYGEASKGWGKFREAEKREAVLREALEESHEIVIYVQNNTDHLEGCPDIPMTCVRCAVDDLRVKNRAALKVSAKGE